MRNFKTACARTVPRTGFPGAVRTEIPSMVKGHGEGVCGTLKQHAPVQSPEGISGSRADGNTFHGEGAWEGRMRN